MQGFAVGLGRDLYIPECAETEDSVEGEPFRKFEGFNEKYFRAGYGVW